MIWINPLWVAIFFTVLGIGCVSALLGVFTDDDGVVKFGIGGLAIAFVMFIAMPIVGMWMWVFA